MHADLQREVEESVPAARSQAAIAESSYRMTDVARRMRTSHVAGFWKTQRRKASTAKPQSAKQNA